MSETAASRPRPKPRPRPRPTTSGSGDAIGSAAAASGTLFGEIVVNDSDEQFVVNRGRTKETWKKLDDFNKITVAPTSDSENDAGKTSTPLRKRAKKSGTPQWRKIGGEHRLLSTSSSSGSDGDVEFVGTDTPGRGKDPLTPNKRKRQKGRTKSCSLTPPPDLPAAVIANARNIVRQALDKQHAPSVPTYDDFDNSTDTIVLDPELERIAKAVNTQNPSVLNLSEDTGERVVIFVKWQKHPLNILEQEPTWSYRMRVDESFRELFEMVAEDARVFSSAVVLSYNNKRVFPSTRPDSLGLCGEVQLAACHQKTYDYIHQQARTFRQTQSLASSPMKEKPFHSVEEDVINIESDDGDEDDNDIIYTGTNVDASHTNPINTDLSPPKPSQEESEAESEADVGKFKLVLRSDKIDKDVTLIVRPTTKCGSIVKAYIKKAGLAEQYPHLFEGTATEETESASRGRGRGRGRGRTRGRGKGKGKEAASVPYMSILSGPRICVDGDKMDNNTEIREAGLDDGDMVDVVEL